MIATRKNDHRLMQVLLGPVISEKATLVAEKNEQVVFEVARDADKLEIKAAVEMLFKVTVASINTQQYVGKVKTRNTTQGLAIGRVNRSKRAFVTLKDGDKIDFYASV